MVAWIAGPGVHWVDVGQGAAAIVVGGEGSVVVVDSGPASGANAMVAALHRHQVHQVDLWVHTHFDADHVGGLPRVLWGMDGRPKTPDDIEVLEAWDRGLADLPATRAVDRYLDAVWDVRRTPDPSVPWIRNDVAVRVELGAAGVRENGRGLAVCVDLGEIRLFMPGDLPAALATERAAMCSDADVLWLGHHGARDGTSPDLLDRVGAPLIVGSAGMENGHCHPHGDVLTLLGDRQVWMTGGAGLGPGGACQPLAPALGPRHRIAAGDLWLSLAQ